MCASTGLSGTLLLAIAFVAQCDASRGRFFSMGFRRLEVHILSPRPLPPENSRSTRTSLLRYTTANVELAFFCAAVERTGARGSPVRPVALRPT
jgi:hypothetical protein